MDLKLSRTSRIIAIGSLALIVLLPLLFFILLNFLPANTYLGRILSDKFGREFSVEGPLRFSWHSGTPIIHARGIRLANMDGSADPYMLEIDDFRLQFRFWPLLTGKFDIPALTIVKPKLILEKSESGGKNWELPAFSGGKAAVDATLPKSRHEFPVIEKLVIQDGIFMYRDPKGGLDIDLRLDNVSGQSSDKKNAIAITGGGTMQKKEFSLNATGGSIDALRNADKAFPLDLNLTMGGTVVDLKGTFDDPIRMKGINADLTLSGPNMADLFYLTAIPLPPTPSYKITGRLGKEDDIWSYRDFSGLVGSSDLSGSAVYNTGGERGKFVGNFLSRNMDIKDLGGFIGQSPSTGQKKAPDRVLPDVKLDLSRLRATDMDVNLMIEKLKAPDIPFKSMDIHFDLQQGLLKLDPMRLTLADGTIAGKMTLDGREDIPQVAMNLDVLKLQLQRFFDGTRFAPSTKGLIGGNIDLNGKGLSLADVLAGSNGRIVIAMSGGTMSLLLIEAMDLDIAEALPLFLDKKEKQAGIRCMVGDFNVRRGVLRSDVFVLDTTDSNIQGQASINLKNETINAKFDAQPKDGSVLSLQSPIEISGKLKKPSVSIDLAEAGARGGAAGLLSLLTPLAAILPFIDTGVGEDSDCATLLRRT